MCRKIGVFTGTRAEYGLLYWIIKALNESPDVELQLYVGGMHLSPEFGYTIAQIEKDGLPIAERMEFLLSSDTPVGIAKSMGLAIINAAEVIARQEPDIIVLLGDRFESMAIAQAAMVSCTPLAHIHGGETTEGLIDEAVRHSLTKMSHLHFTATEDYKNRVVQLGEQPNRVFNFGAPGIDSIVKLPLLERKELSAAIDFDVDGPYFMVTYHPVTLEANGAAQSLNNLLSVLDDYPEHKIVMTYPNADTHGRSLINILDTYKAENPDRILLSQSLGQLRYLSLMKFADAVIGNSSSGLIETPTFQVPTINIGNRQKGRISGETVVDCLESREAIKLAFELVLSDKFKYKIKHSENPYGKGDSSEKIVECLINHPLNNIVVKQFFDLG